MACHKNSMLTIGVDVGGTNTDAVLLNVEDKSVIATAKHPTTKDVSSGLYNAIKDILNNWKIPCELDSKPIQQVNIGTTHFVNAVIQRKYLSKVSVIRLCGYATGGLPPFSDFPTDIAECIAAKSYLVQGGFEFDAKVNTEVDLDEIRKCLAECRSEGVSNLVISGVFSPVDASQEQMVGKLLREEFPTMSYTLSHRIGELGILERENAAILNESLKPLCRRTLTALDRALRTLQLHCPFFLTQNDGTIISASNALEYPVLTFASGPTNSMRGAFSLSGIENAVVADIGGTSTDIGMLVSGFPRQASTQIQVGGVRTNFRMPDVHSIGLGGGSIVRQRHCEVADVSIGPDSVAYELQSKSLVFGGDTLTASDVAVASGLTKSLNVTLGDEQLVAGLDAALVRTASDNIRKMLEQAIDKVKISGADVCVILVGGGSVLVDRSWKLSGVSQIIIPQHFDVANAVGAALSQVSGSIDSVIDLSKHSSRADAISHCKSEAIRLAIEAGAKPDTVQIVEVCDLPLTYLPGNASRIKARAVGDLDLVTSSRPVAAETDQLTGGDGDESQTVSFDTEEEVVGHVISATGGGGGSEAASASPQDPHIDPVSGEWRLSQWDVDCICTGAGILGCGGGGSPHIGRLRLRDMIRSGKVPRIISVQRAMKTLGEDALVLPIAFIGAPLIMIERLISNKETINATHALTQLYHDLEHNKEKIESARETGQGVTYIDDYPLTPFTDHTPVRRLIKAVTCWEVGGFNSMEPLCLAAQLDVPIIDADGMGRAFPELQMFTPCMYGISTAPCIIADEKHKCGAILTSQSAKHTEDHFRAQCIRMGCLSAYACRLMSLNECDRFLIKSSMSRAWRLGEAVLKARKHKLNPVRTILDQECGSMLAQGKIIDVNRVLRRGFNLGEFLLDGLNTYTGSKFCVKFQNEFLLAERLINESSEVTEHTNHNILASTPDLICVVDTDTGEPVTTDELRYGQLVTLLMLPSHPLIHSAQALRWVGPQAFGYPVDYLVTSGWTDTVPVPPL